jgi:hypothetical protein
LLSITGTWEGVPFFEELRQCSGSILVSKQDPISGKISLPIHHGSCCCYQVEGETWLATAAHVFSLAVQKNRVLCIKGLGQMKVSEYVKALNEPSQRVEWGQSGAQTLSAIRMWGSSGRKTELGNYVDAVRLKYPMDALKAMCFGAPSFLSEIKQKDGDPVHCLACPHDYRTVVDDEAVMAQWALTGRLTGPTSFELMQDRENPRLLNVAGISGAGLFNSKGQLLGIIHEGIVSKEWDYTIVGRFHPMDDLLSNF